MRIILTLLLSIIVSCSKINTSGKDSGISERDLAVGSNIPLDLDQGLGLFRNIYFDFDSAELNPRAIEDLNYNLMVLNQQPNLIVTLEGHCDVRGTKEYNYALGQRRANSVRNWLIMNGISSTRLKTVSYGSDMPVALGNSEEDHATNRRVHFRHN